MPEVVDDNKKVIFLVVLSFLHMFIIFFPIPIIPPISSPPSNLSNFMFFLRKKKSEQKKRAHTQAWNLLWIGQLPWTWTFPGVWPIYPVYKSVFIGENWFSLSQLVWLANSFLVGVGVFMPTSPPQCCFLVYQRHTATVFVSSYESLGQEPLTLRLWLSCCLLFCIDSWTLSFTLRAECAKGFYSVLFPSCGSSWWSSVRHRKHLDTAVQLHIKIPRGCERMLKTWASLSEKKSQCG